MRRLILAALVVFLALAATACSFNVSTANLAEVKACSKLTDGVCSQDTSTFAADTPEIFVSTKLNNAPDETKVTFTWRYLEGGGQDIDSVTLTTKNGENTAQSSLSKPSNGWPTGRYEVVVKLDTDNSKPVSKEFKVE